MSYFLFTTNFEYILSIIDGFKNEMEKNKRKHKYSVKKTKAKRQLENRYLTNYSHQTI